MQKDDTIQEDELELENVTTETEDNELTEDELLEDEEVLDEKQDEAKKLKAENLKLKAIIARKFKKTQANPINNQPNVTPDNLFKEEVTLLAQGYSPEILEQAKVFAQGSKTTLTQALESPAMVALKKIEDATFKRKQASLRASTSSPQFEETKFKSGMSQEEHKKLWREKMGL